MTDFTDDEGTESDIDHEGVEEEPPSYRSGRVRIIGAEPAGDAVPEAPGPAADAPAGDGLDMPHWNDAPTGQVPAILDRATGEEPLLAPPTWREEETDWEAHEELFEPSMLSDDLPPVGALINDNNEQVDVERQPWHFASEDLPVHDDTLIIEPDYPLDTSYLADARPTAAAATPAAPAAATADETNPRTEAVVIPPFAGEPQSGDAFVPEPAIEPVAVPAADAEPGSASGSEPRLLTGRSRRRPVPIPTPSDAASAAAAARLTPPGPPQPRAPRTSRLGGRGTRTAAAAAAANAGADGRNMQVAIISGLAFAAVALACFAGGAVSSLVLVTVVVVLAAAELYAVFRKAQYHPATLLGLVAALSLMVETYNKGVAALPLVIVLLVAGSFVWFMAKVEPGADPVAGMVSTVFVFGYIGGFGSFAALLLNPTLFPHRHGVAFLLAAVVVTGVCDITALLVGSAMGKHPLAPSISPNKSWEGVIGGAVGAILSAVIIIHFVHPWTVGKALVLGVVVAIVAPLGDLSQSTIKRHLGLKDMGRLLPGHGGLLDRFDGLLFVLPATYFVVKAFHLG